MKRVSVFFAALAALALSASVASADHTLGGYFRTQFMSMQPPSYQPPSNPTLTFPDDRSLHTEVDELDLDNSLPTGQRVYGSYTLQGRSNDFHRDAILMNRLSLGYRYGFSNNWSLTYAGELDNARGDHYRFYGNDNYLFYKGLDTETVRAHLDYRTPEAFQLRAGIQAAWDNMDGMIVVDNVLGIKTIARLGPVDTTFMYANFYQEDTLYDEADLLSVQLQYGSKDSGGLSLGLDYFNFIYETIDIDYLGLSANYDFGKSAVGGAFVHNFGEIDDYIDVSTYAATIKASTQVGSLEFKGRLFYFSGDDNPIDFKIKRYMPIHGMTFPNDGSMIFLWDSQQLPQKKSSFAFMDVGLKGGSLSASWTAGGAFISTYLGYFSAIEDSLDIGASRNGKTLGTEAAMRMGYKLNNGLEMNINGAKAFLGSFFEINSPGGVILDNPYIVYATVKMPFGFDF
jgi:hypothetical protein